MQAKFQSHLEVEVNAVELAEAEADVEVLEAGREAEMERKRQPLHWALASAQNMPRQ